MTISKPARKERPENAARRRRQLVEATIASIAEHGLSATTLASVSRIAGLSQGVAVFYFQTKERLLTAAFEAHCMEYDQAWRTALAGAPADPVARLAALMLADMDPAICTTRNLALWHAFWAEAKTRPLFGRMSDRFDADRLQVLDQLSVEAAPRADSTLWSPRSVSTTLDAFTDGLWNRMHISAGGLSLAEAQKMLTQLLIAIFPEERGVIDSLGEALAETDENDA